MGYNFTAIEKKWQAYWLANRTFAALDPADAGDMPKAYILDMFPYPSGAGLHVGHPEGYTATDIVSRYLRMTGANVLHPIGWDAFGLPAEQYAIKTNTHPRVTTEQNIANFRRQIQMLGLSYDWDREVNTTDPGYVKWTQWIFLQLFNSYFDPIEQKAKPISHLMLELVNNHYVVTPDNRIVLNPTGSGMEPIVGEVRTERLWIELSPGEQREFLDSQRLAYMDEVAVNWCPGLGTVLANEEVIDGKSEVGGFAVEKRPMRQWMLRITAYADRLIKDLDLLQWPESLKEMQRNWIGRSVGAEVDFDFDPDSLPANAGVEEEASEIDALSPEDRAQAPSKQDLGEKDLSVTVFTTRPDTLYGATYLVLAPEHELVSRITSDAQKTLVEGYIAQAKSKSDRDRMADAKVKTGVFTGAYAINPINDARVPVYIADYVLTGYGTGAIMAVPAHDERDFEFAKKFNLPITAVVMPDDQWLRDNFAIEVAGANVAAQTNAMFPDRGAAATPSAEALSRKIHDKNFDVGVARGAYLAEPGKFPSAYTGEGMSVNSPAIDGQRTAQAKEGMIALLAAEGDGLRSVKYKLRDWLFSRQRYWGEPFPILLDAEGNAYAVDESELPISLPEMSDFKPTGTPMPPLSKAREWVDVTRDGKPFARETNTMPQWAGSCWYYLRYCDPKNPKRFIDPAKEKYWMPVDLYVGGVEHAVLHLLYSRFWHKVLFDLGHVSTSEPFARLVNQGLILGEMEYHAFADAQGNPVSAAEVRDINEEANEAGVTMFAFRRSDGARLTGKRVEEADVVRNGEAHLLKANPEIRLDARSFKMSKSRGNVVNPDAIVRDYGADTFRLYEMYMGPLEAQKPWNTRDIVGMSRFLNGVWRNLVGVDETDAPDAASKRIGDGAIPDALARQMHRTIKKVADDITLLRFNTAIAELIKLNNELTHLPSVPRALAENFALMLAPFAPHIAEEIWARLGHTKTLARRPWPSADPAMLTDSTIELPVQVNGKLRGRVTVPADADESQVLTAAAAATGVGQYLEGKTIAKKLYVQSKLVNFVVK